MSKNRVIHARIDDDIHDKLFEKCNELGCSFTDYIESVIESSLEDEPSDIESEPIIEKRPEPTTEIIPELTNVRIIDD